MSEVKLGPLPKTEWVLHMPARPYEHEWTSSQDGYEEGDMQKYTTSEVLKERARWVEEVNRALAKDPMLAATIIAGATITK